MVGGPRACLCRGRVCLSACCACSTCICSNGAQEGLLLLALCSTMHPRNCPHADMHAAKMHQQHISLVLRDAMSHSVSLLTPPLLTPPFLTPPLPASLPAFPVDTHVHRLAQRWGLTAGGGSTVSSVEQTVRGQGSCVQWSSSRHGYPTVWGGERGRACSGDPAIVRHAL